jgi:hypothetical protein
MDAPGLLRLATAAMVGAVVSGIIQSLVPDGAAFLVFIAIGILLTAVGAFAYAAYAVQVLSSNVVELIDQLGVDDVRRSS